MQSWALSTLRLGSLCRRVSTSFPGEGTSRRGPWERGWACIKVYLQIYLLFTLYADRVHVQWVIACSRLSDRRARQSVGSELNCTRGKRGRGRGVESERTRPFPVYNLTRSLLTAALYYLNAWTRLNELSQLWAPGIILQPRPQGAFHWLQRPGNEVDNLSAPALG